MSKVNLYFANPAAQLEKRRDQIDAAIQGVLDAGVFVHGPAHDRFEQEFADYLGVKHAIAVANGTDALVLALAAMGIGYEDEVIVPSHTASPTISAIRQVGATPRFVDVSPFTYVIDIENVAAAIGPATKAVVGVHLYGRPFDAVGLRRLLDAKGIFLIEDCAQAAGASIGQRRVGTFGHSGCFSFFPTKNLGGVGDGGAVVTDDDDTADHLRRLRLYGWSDNRTCIEDGKNSRLDELQAAVLSVNLKYLDADNKKRVTIAGLYNERLAGLEIDLPLSSGEPEKEHVFHLYVVACDKRDEMMAHLLEDGIVCGVHYAVPCHMHPAHQAFCDRPIPNTEHLAGRILSLPMYPELSEGDIDRVCRSICSFFA